MRFEGLTRVFEIANSGRNEPNPTPTVLRRSSATASISGIAWVCRTSIALINRALHSVGDH
jgi:hypothetical protein